MRTCLPYDAGAQEADTWRRRAVDPSACDEPESKGAGQVGRRGDAPEGMAALTRDASHAMGPSWNAYMEASVNEAEPSAVTAIVRMPAGRSGDLRSSAPNAPPHPSAATRRVR